QLRRGAGDNHLRTLRRAVHFKQHHAHALAHGKLLKARLLTLGAAGFRLADIEYRVLAFDALDGGVQDLLFAMGVFLEDGVALGFANLLENHLLGQLRGNAAQRAGVAIEANLAAHLDSGSEFVGFSESDLVDRVFDLVLVGNHSLVYVGRDFAGVLVQLPAHVFLGLVILAGGQGNRFLNSPHHNGGVNALFLAQNLDALVQRTGHTLVFRRLPGAGFLGSDLRPIELGFQQGSEASCRFLLPTPGTPGEDSDLRSQLRLLNILQGNLDRVPACPLLFHRPGGLAFRQIKCDAVPIASDQAPLPVAVIAYRLQGSYLDETAGEPLEILRPRKLAIQSRRAGLERISLARNQVFHVEQGPEVATESGAVFVGDARQLLHSQFAAGQIVRQAFHPR